MRGGGGGGISGGGGGSGGGEGGLKPGPSQYASPEVPSVAIPAADRRDAWIPKPCCPDVVAVAGVSLRGHNPLMHKVNQDAMVMVEHAGTGSLLVAVFDGHGVQGHDVSGFVARNFVSTLLRDARFTTPGTASGPGGTDVDMCEVLSEALLSAEKALLNESSIDCSLSGSTAVAGVLRAGRLWTIGVGDSRLVLGFVPQSRKNTGINQGDPPWYTRQVTVDHKPELPAEKRRIIAAGGRVMATRNRMAPHIVGPPRVWLRDMPAPGLAMSRSVGDMVGKAAGVVSTPDRFVVDLEGACRALVLGSDGLWDFVANEEVVQTVQRCGGAKQAADALLRIARSRWLQRTGGADDTTIVVVYVRPEAGVAAAAVAAAHSDAAASSGKGSARAPEPQQAESPARGRQSGSWGTAGGGAAGSRRNPRGSLAAAGKGVMGRR